MRYRVLPIPTKVAEAVRRTGRAPGYGHAAQPSVAGPDGYGPCRHCLGRTREGEGRLLFNYNPYFGMNEVPVVGPIFVHEADCAAFAGDGYPEELRGLPLIAQGHLADAAGLIHAPGDPELTIPRLFADPRIAFITLRNTEAGCFVARVVRAAS
jgi:hypothetical protein